jgi:ABC-type ATPase involved in cell division
MIDSIEAKDQLEVINKYKKHINDFPFSEDFNGDKQIIGFLSGQGGTGKSLIINLISEIANLTYGKTEGMYGQTINAGLTGYSGRYY